VLSCARSQSHQQNNPRLIESVRVGNALRSMTLLAKGEVGNARALWSLDAFGYRRLRSVEYRTARASGYYFHKSCR